MKTTKLYYKEPYLKRIDAKIIDVLENRIILDQSPAYPEGGGQEGDRGFFIIKGQKIPFFDTQKGVGRVIYLENFPTIQVDTPIFHYVAEESLSHFRVGDSLTLEIDTLRRAKLSISHSAIHLVLMALERIFPNYESRIYGASIKEDSARLDFRTEEKFKPEHIKQIEDDVNRMIKEEMRIEVFPHEKEPEAWYWRCGEKIYACGGTHIENTKFIGEVKLKRKNLGRSGQRVSMTYSSNDFFQEKFYS